MILCLENKKPIIKHYTSCINMNTNFIYKSKIYLRLLILSKIYNNLISSKHILFKSIYNFYKWALNIQQLHRDLF